MKPYPEKISKAGEEVFIWRVVWRVLGKQKRKNFKSKKDAEAWGKEHRDKCRKEGSDAIGQWESIQKSERYQFLQAREHYLEKGGDPASVPWLEAMTEYVERSMSSKILFRDATNKVVARVKKVSKEGSGYAENLDICLNKMCQTFGDRNLDSISRREIWEYLHAQKEWGASTFNKYHGYFKKVYDWAIDASRFSGENPMRNIKRWEKSKNTNEIIVPSPTAIHRVLEAASKNPEQGMEAYFILSFFFGLRTTEIKRLRRTDISDKEGGHIRVTAGAAKTSHRRVINLDDPVFAFWSTRLFEALENNPTIVPEGMEGKRERICKQAGITWEQNVGRHSAATFHFNFYGDASKTIKLLGHDWDVRTFEQNYRAIDYREENILKLVLPADAAAYYRVCISKNDS